MGKNTTFRYKGKILTLEITNSLKPFIEGLETIIEETGCGVTIEKTHQTKSKDYINVGGFNGGRDVMITISQDNRYYQFRSFRVNEEFKTKIRELVNNYK
jgi:hypothetical protein